MSEQELLPCPFCGEHDIFIKRTEDFKFWYIYCEECSTTFCRSVSKEHSIDRWNTRTPPLPQPVQDEVKAVTEPFKAWIKKYSITKTSGEFTRHMCDKRSYVEVLITPISSTKTEGEEKPNCNYYEHMYKQERKRREESEIELSKIHTSLNQERMRRKPKIQDELDTANAKLSSVTNENEGMRDALLRIERNYDHEDSHREIVSEEKDHNRYHCRCCIASAALPRNGEGE